MKKIILVGMALAMCANPFAVMAKQGTEQGALTYKNITVYADGELVDTTGAEPFIYNGTTYLPVRAIANAVGKEVNWVGETNTVYLGAMPSAYVETDTRLEDMYSYNNSFAKIEHVEKGADNQNQKHESGCILNCSGVGADVENKVEYSLNGKYKSFEAVVAVPYVERKNQNTKTLRIYSDDKEIYSSEPMKADSQPEKIELDVSDTSVLKIEVEGSGLVGLYDAMLYAK